ncbi:MAG: hypothetical protein UT69_C0037G0006 [Candidatus Yanofskybacteria bacterium GW2011_GWE1_40_10]|nr:MAG: hypothetical protein UT69_C0037G0006 [Candidatus Yanofskybacteria bacterium GW2011_GWE1_40_10]
MKLILTGIAIGLMAAIVFNSLENWRASEADPTQLQREAKQRAFKVILDKTGEPQLVETK